MAAAAESILTVLSGETCVAWHCEPEAFSCFHQWHHTSLVWNVLIWKNVEKLGYINIIVRSSEVFPEQSKQEANRQLSVKLIKIPWILYINIDFFRKESWSFHVMSKTWLTSAEWVRSNWWKIPHSANDEQRAQMFAISTNSPLLIWTTTMHDLLQSHHWRKPIDSSWIGEGRL